MLKTVENGRLRIGAKTEKMVRKVTKMGRKSKFIWRTKPHKEVRNRERNVSKLEKMAQFVLVISHCATSVRF